MRIQPIDAAKWVPLAFLLTIQPAIAQFGGVGVPHGGDFRPRPGFVSAQAAMVTVYPFGYFAFDAAGRPGSDPAGVRQKYDVRGRVLGAIVAVEKAFPVGSHILALGGWMALPYSRTETFIQRTGPGAGTMGTESGKNNPFVAYAPYSVFMELHGKYFFNSTWGVQTGVIGGSNGGGEEVDSFLLYNLAPARAAGSLSPGWNLQLGAGFFLDPQPVAGSRFGPSLFADETLEMGHGWGLSGSYWFLKDGSTTGNRFAVGVSRRM